MLAWDNLVIMGQDIAEYGGAFKITEGFVNKFGRERVRNTPYARVPSWVRRWD